MAIFGDVGKFLGLGTTRDTLQGALQGAARGALIGQPFMGAGAGALANGTNQGQKTAVSIPPNDTQETSTSGSTDSQNLFVNTGFTSPYPFLQEASMTGRSSMNQMQQFNKQSPMISQALLPLGPVIGAGAALAAPFIIDALTGEQKKLVVTRKLKGKVKRAVDLIGVEATADGMNVSPDIVLFILMKKLRNDGAFVTKAAMRKTSSTLRKMKRMCDMYDDLRPAAKRRAPVRKAGQTITNVR
jgi:hypothetical protein